MALLMSYLSVKISPATWWVPAFFGLAYPYLLLGNILFILFWLFAKPKLSIISFLAIAIGYGNLDHYYQLSEKEMDVKGIMLCSYNVKNFSIQNAKKRNEIVGKIFNYLESKKPDIVCMQEADPNFTRHYFNKSKDKKGNSLLNLKYSHYSKIGGQVTLTNYPIIRKNEVHFSNSMNMFIISDLKIGNDTVRLFNCHLESYHFSSSDINKIDDISLSSQEESYKQVRHTGSKLKQGFIKRAQQVEKLHELITQSPYKVIVCGDFNDTPVSYTYHTVSQGLVDTFVESGKGIGNTYLGKLPSFRIDYIFHSPEFEGYNFHVDKVNYSDHYPIRGKLILKDQ